MSYLERTVDRELDLLLEGAPAIALDGPKGVGKTDTAMRRADTAWMLDDPDIRQRISADFTLTAAGKGTVLLDEWQRLPQVWDSVRRQVDHGVPSGRFLLTGSATPIDSVGTHSGAGRILSLRMRPMGLHERGLTDPTVSLSALLSGSAAAISGETPFSLSDYADAIISSGFPGTRGMTPRLVRAFLDTYLLRIIDQDLPGEGFAVRRPETLRRWLAAYAAASSTATSYSRLLDAAVGPQGTQPSKVTTLSYREHLSRLWLLDPIEPWLPSHNALTALRQAPKHQLADPALAARLLNLTTETLLAPSGANKFGPLFESLVALGVRVMAQAAEATTHHLRTKAGEREIDLIVQGHDGRVLAIEVKLASAVNDSDVRHLLWLKDKLGEQVADLVVVTTGPAAYRRRDGIAVVPLALFGA